MSVEAFKPDTSLQFLVVDMGTHCIVKMEKGGGMAGHNGHRMEQGDVEIFKTSFDDLRKIWDESCAYGKPVPRIERSPAGSQSEYRLVLHDDNNLVCPERSIGMTHADLQGLTTFVRGRSLAGHPLPIYEGGTWELLTTETTFARLPMNVYRYTRGGE